MVADMLGFDGTESAGAYVKRHFAPTYATAVDFREYLVGEMKPGCRSGYRPFDSAVDGLIVIAVARFCIAVEVGGYRYLACC